MGLNRSYSMFVLVKMRAVPSIPLYRTMGESAMFTAQRTQNRSLDRSMRRWRGLQAIADDVRQVSSPRGRLPGDSSHFRAPQATSNPTNGRSVGRERSDAPGRASSKL